MNVPALLATYQLRQREYLLRITRAMTSRLDLPSLLKLILSSAAEMVGCRAGLIVLARAQAGRLANANVIPYPPFQIRAVYNIPPQFWPAFEPLLDIVPEVEDEEIPPDAEGDEAIRINGARSIDSLDLQARVRQVEERLGITLGQVVGLPLLFEEELLGMIYLFRSEYAFTEMDWQFLQGFAYQAAIAVRNARLYTQLETERSRLATIIENSADGILILDANRRVEVINQALAAMVGMSQEEAVGRPCHEVLALSNVVGDDLCQSDWGQFNGLEFIADGVGLRCEGDLIRPGGGRIIVSATFTPLYDEARHLVNIIVNVHDITRFREEEEMKSTFTSIISHELKTPVALIKGYAQTLARPDAQWDAETARHGLQVIEEEADRLEALINNLLDVSRIQAGGLRLDYADVDLVALVTKVVEAYRTQTSVHRIELDFPHPLPLIWGDEERLRQVLTNLLSNAIKYSPEGGVIRVGGWSTPASAQDGLEREPARVTLFVADQGIGIPQEELPHIFDRFYRVDSSLRRSTAGAGLGLFLARAIVEAHGGQIWARSEPGKGTTFFVSLPVAQGEGPHPSASA
ncbi:MAG TPA: ATP-binding protein [Caldilineaceae bacterium]|nr:ATP-binding protein [Caldilineaceae bacterium]